MTARPLYKVDSTMSDADRVENLERRLETLHELLDDERQLCRDLAEKNGMLAARLHLEQGRRRDADEAAAKWKSQAAKWRALLLKEQVKHLPPRETP